MIDLKLVRNETDFVKEKLATRGVDAAEESTSYLPSTKNAAI